MQPLAEIYRSEGVNILGKTIHRYAVRAVILRGQELLMIRSAKVGDYKFPGGGVDQDESHEQALVGEVKEECGMSLLYVGQEICRVIEYERDLGFVPVWVSIDQAIQINKFLSNCLNPPDWQKREVLVLEHIQRSIF